MDEWFNTASVWLLYLTCTLVIVIAAETGSALAGRLRTRDVADADRFLSALATPSMGLLALMIGFTFAMSLSRFEARKSAVLNEANAIGTAALRGRMLPEPYSSAVAPLLRQYATVRIEDPGLPLHSAANAQAIRTSLDIQEKLWQQAMGAAAANAQVVPTGLFIDALNNMIDLHETRLTAGRNHVPALVFLVLEGIAVVATGFLGYGEQWAGTYRRYATWIMAVLIGSVIMLIIDLDRPQGGSIMVSQQPLLELIDSMP